MGAHQPQPEVEEERYQELEHASLVGLLQDERIRVNELTLHPAAPVSDGFPDKSHGSHLQEEPKEIVQDNRDRGEVVAIDVNASEQAYHGGDGDEYSPVPLPPPTDGSKSLGDRKVELAMLGQVDKRGDEREGE